MNAQTTPHLWVSCVELATNSSKKEGWEQGAHLSASISCRYKNLHGYGVTVHHHVTLMLPDRKQQPVGVRCRLTI